MGSLRFFAGDVLVEEIELQGEALTLAAQRLDGPDAQAVSLALRSSVAASLALDGRWQRLFGEQTLRQAAEQLRVELHHDDNAS